MNDSDKPIRSSKRSAAFLAAGLLFGTAAAAATTAADVVAQREANLKLTPFTDAIRVSGGPITNLDGAAAAANLSVRLMVPELSTSFEGPSGTVVHIPIQVTPREGGRVSIFQLQPGESSNVGVYVVNGKTYDRQVTRRGGAGLLAKGELLEERILNMQGQLVQTLTYRVTGINHQIGALQAANVAGDGPATGDIVNDGEGWCWFCNGGSTWWCGFQCLPGTFGDDDTGGTTAARN